MAGHNPRPWVVPVPTGMVLRMQDKHLPHLGLPLPEHWKNVFPTEQLQPSKIHVGVAAGGALRRVSSQPPAANAQKAEVGELRAWVAQIMLHLPLGQATRPPVCAGPAKPGPLKALPL